MVSYFLSKMIKKLHIPAVRKSLINKKSKICSGAHIVGCNIDRYSYVGNFSTVINTRIGSFCSIADNCVIGQFSHPIDWVSTSPVSYIGKNCLGVNISSLVYEDEKTTIIGNDVWIGSNVLIKAGVSIGSGSVIGMGSVVTKDIPPYEIWAGNPAHFIRKRFDTDIAAKLMELQWWNYSDDELKKYVNYFDHPEKFIEEVVKNENPSLG